MKLKPLTLATAATLGAVLALGACKRDAPITTDDVAVAPTPAPAPAEPTPAPLPDPSGPPLAAVTAVDLGSTVDTDGRVVTGTSTFAPSDTITASVTTDTGAQTSATGPLGARWTYEDGQVVNEESKTFEFDGRGITNFQISKPDGWPAGRYRVEILLDGDIVQTRDFEVRA